MLLLCCSVGQLVPRGLWTCIPELSSAVIEGVVLSASSSMIEGAKPWRHKCRDFAPEIKELEAGKAAAAVTDAIQLKKADAKAKQCKPANLAMREQHGLATDTSPGDSTQHEMLFRNPNLCNPT